jgi:hypothetical protein
VSPLDKKVTNLQRLKHMTQRDSGLYMQVLRRLVGADEHMYAFHADSLQWLAEADLLEMLVDKLSPLVPFSSPVNFFRIGFVTFVLVHCYIF